MKSNSKIYRDGLARGREEAKQQIENLRAHIARVEAENKAMREGKELPPMKEAS